MYSGSWLIWMFNWNIYCHFWVTFLSEPQSDLLVYLRNSFGVPTLYPRCFYWHWAEQQAWPVRCLSSESYIVVGSQPFSKKMQWFPREICKEQGVSIGLAWWKMGRGLQHCKVVREARNWDLCAENPENRVGQPWGLCRSDIPAWGKRRSQILRWEQLGVFKNKRDNQGQLSRSVEKLPAVGGEGAELG